MLSQPDGPFINVPKLNLAKYAQRQNLAKVCAVKFQEGMWGTCRVLEGYRVEEGCLESY